MVAQLLVILFYLKDFHYFVCCLVILVSHSSIICYVQDLSSFLHYLAMKMYMTSLSDHILGCDHRDDQVKARLVIPAQYSIFQLPKGILAVGSSFLRYLVMSQSTLMMSATRGYLQMNKILIMYDYVSFLVIPALAYQ